MDESISAPMGINVSPTHNLRKFGQDTMLQVLIVSLFIFENTQKRREWSSIKCENVQKNTYVKIAPKLQIYTFKPNKNIVHFLYQFGPEFKICAIRGLDLGQLV